MNFYEHQHRAKRYSFLLVLVFLGGVAALSLALYFVALPINWLILARAFPHTFHLRFWYPGLAMWVTGCTSVLVFGTSIVKMRQLRGGGYYVAMSMGARPLNPATQDVDERRMLNVVEEMSIAAGCAVPTVFVLQRSSGINAMIAGHDMEDAALIITAGCLEKLNRDEMQAVAAHEFSHMLNGDMKLNMKLIGMLHGVMVIWLVGESFVDNLSAAIEGETWTSRRGTERSGGAMFLAGFIGMGLLTVGVFGVVFGQAILCAIARQREYLADAAAVQWTRNPRALATALVKSRLDGGSSIRVRGSGAYSFMFFTDGAAHMAAMDGLFPSHPPLQDRVMRAYPEFTGRIPEAKEERIVVKQPQVQMPVVPHQASRDLPPIALAEAPTGDAVNVISYDQSRQSRASAAGGSIVTEMPVASLAYAAALVAALPESLSEAAHTASLSDRVIFALLLDDDDQIRRKQLNCIRDHIGDHAVMAVRQLFDAMADLEPRARLPLAELAMPLALSMDAPGLQRFGKVVRALIEADGKLSVFEFALHKLVLARLARRQVEGETEASHESRKPAMSESAAAVQVLSTLAYHGADTQAEAEQAFTAAICALPQRSQTSWKLLSRELCGLKAFGSALDELAALKEKARERFVDVARRCVLADQLVTAREAELLRVVAETLRIAMPPVLEEAATPADPIA